MKKIIYSLVIMIAAGSLFTSCVNYDEPVGVQDLREAKASYLDALSGLRAAEAEVQKSLAAINNGKAEWEKANAAYRMAEAKKQEILNETEKAKADTLIAGAKKQAEIAAINYQKAMAEAQKALEETQKRIAAEALALTKDEKDAINNAVTYLTAALGQYNTAVGNVETAKANLFKIQNGIAVTGIPSINDKLTAEEYKAAQNDSIADAKAEIEKLNARKDALSSDPDVQAWTAYVDGLKAEVKQNSYDSAKAVAAQAVLSQSLIKDAATAAAAEFTAWKKENKVTLKEKKVELYWPVPAWAAQSNGIYATAFVNLMRGYLNTLDSQIDVLSTPTIDGDNYIALYGSVNGVDSLLNGYASGNDVQKIGLKGIISVIEDNELLRSDTSSAKSLATAATKAANKYAADLDTLKKGLKAYMALDTNYTKAVADTVLAVDSLKLEIDTLHTAIAAVEAVKVADTAAANALVKAVNALAAKVAEVETGLGDQVYSEPDAKALLESIQAFVAAKQAVIGATDQDTLYYVKQVAGAIGSYYDVDSVSILDLKIEDMAQTIVSTSVVGNNRTFVATNKFYEYTWNGTTVDSRSYDLSYTTPKVGSDNGSTNWNDVKTYYPYAVYSIPAVSGNGPFDMILRKYFKYFTWLATSQSSKIALTNVHFGEGANKVVYDESESNELHLKYKTGTQQYKTPQYAEAKAAYDNAFVDSLTFAGKVDEAKEALYAPMAKDINNFAKVYNRFFGISVSGDESAWNNTTWDKGSVEGHFDQYFDKKGEPKDVAKEIADAEYFAELVKGYFIEDVLTNNICSDVALTVAKAMNKFKLSYNDANAIIAKYYKGDFRTMVQSQYTSDLAEAWAESEDILTTLKGWVADAEAAVATVTENNKEYYAAKAEFDEKAYGINAIATALNGITTYYGEYTFDATTATTPDNNGGYEAPKAGQQKVIYDKYLKDLVAQYAEAQKAITNALNRNNAIATLLASAEPAAAAALAVYNNEVNAAQTFAAAYKNVVDAINNLINAQNTKIDNAEWVLAQIAAGVDTKTLAIAAAERALKVAEQALADAEVAMKLAQAQYDAVMAKYVK